MSDDLPKQELLLKLLRMTEAEDNVALIAIKKANKLLRDNGWDWERLLKGKITIIADPFAGKPMTPMTAGRPAAQAPIRPQPAPTSQPAANPWPGGARPQPKPKAARPTYQAPPQQPSAPPVAPATPLHFQKNRADIWCIASHIPLNSMIGQTVNIYKKDGSSTTEVIGPYCEQTDRGYYLYQISKATKWQRKFAGNPTSLDDLL